jgi:hypothetical protein
MIEKKIVVCPDGTSRPAKIGSPDTFFSRPAKCRCGGTRVFGFVVKNDHDVYVFIPQDNQEEGERTWRQSIRE